MPVSPPRSILLRLLALLLALGASPLSAAAVPADKPPKAGLKLPIQAEVERLQKADSGDTQAALALKLNRQALDFLHLAEQDANKTASFRQAIDNASKQQKKLQQEMEALPDPDKALADAHKRWQKADADALNAELTQHQASIAEHQSRVAELQSALARIFHEFAR